MPAPYLHARSPVRRREPSAGSAVRARRTAIALLAVLASASTLANEGSAVPDGPAFSVSGFGTLSAVHSSDRTSDFTSTIFKSAGAGHSDRISPHVDSRLAAQLDVALNQDWSAVVQVVSEQNYDRSYRPKIEWLNVKFQVTPDLSVRAGRIALPIFLSADYRKVGYAYAQARTPREVYAAVPITSSDGLDLTLRWQQGPIKHTTQAFAGATHMEFENPAAGGGTVINHLRARRMAGLTHTIERGDLSARASAMRAQVSLDVARPLFDAYRKFGPAGVALAEHWDVDRTQVEALALGLQYDPGTWFATIETEMSRSRSYLSRTHGSFASLGYRWNTLTPYASFARIRPRSETSSPGLNPASLPPPLRPTATVLNGSLKRLLMSIPDQSRVAFGVRWDAFSSAAFKLQYDRIRPYGGSRGQQINTQPGFRSGQPIHVTSLVLDFVY
jgi:hypothetical protein